MNVGETSYLVSSTYESTMRVGTLLNINTNHTILSRGNIHYMHVSLFHLMLHVNCSMLSMYQVARAPCACGFLEEIHLRRFQSEMYQFQCTDLTSRGRDGQADARDALSALQSLIVTILIVTTMVNNS